MRFSTIILKLGYVSFINLFVKQTGLVLKSELTNATHVFTDVNFCDCEKISKFFERLPLRYTLSTLWAVENVT